MKEAGIAGCTIIAKSQLSAARVLAESWNRIYPRSSFFVLLLDSAAGFFQPKSEPFQVISPEFLGIANLPGFFFRYSQLEAAGAAKPFFFQHLFNQHGVEKLVYLGPESLLLGPLDDVRELLDKADLVLAAQVRGRSVAEEAGRANAEYLKWGLYSPDFIALRDSSNARQILQWWSNSVEETWRSPEEYEVRAERWLDFVLEMFEGVGVLGGPEHNPGYKKVHNTKAETEQERLMANGRPANLFNFRGFDLEQSPTELSSDSTADSRARQLGDLASKYRDSLIKAGWSQTSRWTYTYDFFRLGPKIPASARRYYRNLGSLADELPDPFTWIDDAEAGDGPIAASRSALAQLPIGMNVLGHLRSEKGVGEMVRSNLRVLKAAGIPHVANDFADPGSENVDEGRIESTSENPYRVNLITINAKELAYVVKQRPQYTRGRFNIGYWAWELSQFPQEWTTAFGHLDEVWTLSRFARRFHRRVYATAGASDSLLTGPGKRARPRVEPRLLWYPRGRIRVSVSVRFSQFDGTQKSDGIDPGVQGSLRQSARRIAGNQVFAWKPLSGRDEGADGGCLRRKRERHRQGNFAGSHEWTDERGRLLRLAASRGRLWSDTRRSHVLRQASHRNELFR